MINTRSLLRALPKWITGAVITTPLIAIGQGAVLLADYRLHHADAPRPKLGSGVVIVTSDQDNPDYFATSPKRNAPLRILVIGDSLAAGVGMSQSSTPGLPESIAEALSIATGGQAVLWTCVGTPGVSTSRIIHDIQTLEDFPIPVFQRLNEWQIASRRRAKERLEKTKQNAKEWLEEIKEPVQIEEETEAETNRIQRWGKRVAARLKRDFNGFRRVVVPADEERNVAVDTENVQQEKHTPGRLTRRQTNAILSRSTALDPSMVGKYDIAVVLTGLNDLKDAMLPFMMSREDVASLKDAKKGMKGGFKQELFGVIEALKDKMKEYLPPTVVSQKQERAQYNDGPLVILPALPISPTSVATVAPLCWFLVPLIRSIDKVKQRIAESNPHIVVFVEAPSPEAFTDASLRRGPIWENFLKERVLLKASDIRSNVGEKLEELTKQHYQSWVKDFEDEEYCYTFDGDQVILTQEAWVKIKHPGSNFVAADGIHPNDEGYKAWGRMIGQAIVEEWKKR